MCTLAPWSTAGVFRAAGWCNKSGSHGTNRTVASVAFVTRELTPYRRSTNRSTMATPLRLRTLRLTISRRRPTCTCGYHSYEHETPPPFTPTENAILSAALPHVPSHGFTNTALVHGARDAGYLDVSVNLFPTGAFALVNHHLVTQRLALAQHAPSTEQQPLNIAANVRNLTLRRLHANKPIVHRWQEVRMATALLSHCTNQA